MARNFSASKILSFESPKAARILDWTHYGLYRPIGFGRVPFGKTRLVWVEK